MNDDNKMGVPQERLPERKDEILASGARLRIILKERSGEQELEIVGNRKAFWPLQLSALALLDSHLSSCSPQQIITTWMNTSGAQRRDRFR
jgi:hypothetical protein